MMAGFQLSQNSQAFSRLVQLPAELILIVLRLLLKSPTPIRSLRQEQIKPGIDSDLSLSDQRLSAQVLRCCQYLHQTGQTVLYEENTVALYFSNRRGQPFCYFLDKSTKFASHPLDIPKDSFNLLFYTRSLSPQREANAKELMEERYSALLRFKMIHTVMSLDFHEDVFTACRLLRELVKAKQVTVDLSGCPGEESEVVHMFSLWRCESITFEGVADTTTAPIVKKVTSSLPLHTDLLPAAQRFHNLLKGMKTPTSFTHGLRTGERCVEELWDAIWSYDTSVRSYKQCKAMIASRVKEELGDFMDEEMEDLEKISEIKRARVERRRGARKMTRDQTEDEYDVIGDWLKQEKSRVRANWYSSCDSIWALEMECDHSVMR